MDNTPHDLKIFSTIYLGNHTMAHLKILFFIRVLIRSDVQVENPPLEELRSASGKVRSAIAH